MVSQRCRTCFAGGFRDLFLMRNYDLLTIIGGFFVVMLIYNMASGGFKLSFDGQPVAHSQHLWNILGMYAVGFAAVLAGGCPLRQLILAGQGSSDSAVTFLGLFVGAACCHNFGFAAAAAAAATEAREKQRSSYALQSCLQSGLCQGKNRYRKGDVIMMYEVDARGLSCPEPVLLTANALKTHGSGPIQVLVSENHTKENVRKYGISQGKKVTVEQDGLGFRLIIE